MNSQTEITSASPDNAWIMCDSKSHPGLKFYVNKVTGIKVWNITDTEIAFAEKAGKKENSEPLGRPTMDSPNDARILYNKQVINNQFSNQMPNLLLKSVPVCSQISPWDNPPQIQTQQLFTLVPAAMAPISNHIATNIQSYQQLLPQPSNLQNSSLSYHMAQIQQTPQMSRVPNWKRTKWYRRKSFHEESSQKNFSNANRPDLRRKLVRRNYSGSAEKEQRDHERNDNQNWNDQPLEDPSIQINLVPLKTIASKGSDSEQWYIVVDKDVILKNYNYLINMASADPDCHLVVPHHVMSELREYVSTTNDVQARRIVRFLTQQIESGLAMLGEEVSGEGFPHKTILTCVKLVSRDSHVILISNNEETLNYKTNIKDIHIFTMQDIKDILMNRLIPPRREKSPTLDIKIVIPNNSFSLEDETTNQKAIASTDVTDSSVVTKGVLGVNYVDSSKTEEQNPPKSVTKRFSETGVQTIFEYTENSVNNSKTKDKISKDSEVCSKTDVFTKNTLKINSIDNHSEPENLNPPEIDDNSSSSALSNISLDTVRMKEIISRKRLTRKENKLKVPQELPISSTSKNRQATSETTSPKVHRTKSASTSASCDNDNTSEASVKRTVYENMIVEETSTSAISNSESSFSEKAVSPLKHGFRKVGLKTVFMFEVAGQSMEDILKTRSDEWVFRFVQIMEEVLRVKLHEKLAFEKKEPAPWNLLEAARCIIKRFCNDFNVVDAANKLSFVLYKTSDENGKISVKIEPSDYMKMYSYGVFLVETFQDMSADCKEKDCKKKKTNRSTKNEADSCSCYEVQTASESLKKLLYDIQNANLETFIDHMPSPHDHAIHNANDGEHYDYETETREETQVPEVRKSEQDKMPFEDIANPTRSHKRKSQIKENELPSKVCPRNVTKSKFFNSLQLQKKLNAIKQNVSINDKDLKHADKQNALENKVPCQIKNVVQSPIKPREPEDLADLKCHFSKDGFKDIPKSPSKVVCNFTVNPLFERKVKAKQNQEKYEMYAENENADGYDDRTVDYIPTANKTVDYIPTANKTVDYIPTANKTVDYIPTANKTVDYIPTANKTVDYMPTANETNEYVPTANETDDCMPTANETDEYVPTANDTDDYMPTANEILVPKANQSEHVENNNDSNCEANEKFMCFIGRLTRRFNDVFTQVKLLCDIYIKEVKNECSDVSTRELHHKVEMACSFIGNIHKSLESINKRELQDRDKNIQKLLKIAKIEDFIPDDKLCSECRNAITICTDQAKEFHENLRSVLKIVRR